MPLDRSSIQRIHDTLVSAREAINASGQTMTGQFSGQLDAALNSVKTELGVQEGQQEGLKVLQHLNEPNVSGSGPTGGPVEQEADRQARAGRTNLSGQGEANPANLAQDASEQRAQDKQAPKKSDK
jgi:hypothetical protein